MRILYHHRILARDGMRVHVDELVGALKQQDHELHMVGPDTGGDQGRSDSAPSVLSRIGAMRHRLPRFAAEGMEAAYDLKATRQLAQAAAQVRPDIIYERYNAFLTAGLSVKRRFGLPLLVEINAPLCDERKAHGGLALERLARSMERAVWRGADAVLPVSDALADYLRAAGVAEERIHIIRNGVRLERFSGQQDHRRRAEMGLDGGTVFGFVGYVRPWHGLDRVLGAMARMQDQTTQLMVVGDGPACPDLKRQAAELGLAGRVRFTGAVPHDDVPAYLALFDVALQPDVTAYASPLKLFEYMAAGCAVLAPDRPNIREVVRDGETAALFQADRPDAFEAALHRLAGDSGLRRHLGARAREEVVAKDYSWDGNARRVAAIAERLMAKRATAAAAKAPA
ncbi:MAG: glycosyltransferase family 4 protein [Rhodothalassiaceae bacterium]